MHNYIFLIFLLSSCSGRDANIIESMYNRHKADWKINKIDYRWINFNYYDQQLFNCSMEIKASWVKKVNTYLFLFENKKDVIIEIIDFKDSEKAEQMYQKTSNYAKLLRDTKLNDDWKICLGIREWRFHYVILKHRKLYLIGCVNGDFNFKNGDSSLDSDNKNLFEAREIYEYLLDDAK